MSTRCKSCNDILEIIVEHDIDGEIVLEDLCGNCREAAASEYNYVYDHQFVLEDAEEGLKEPINTENY